ncbi:MAG: glycoside hydrolase family 127 protein [Oscillospiraceae bacterium]|nr:glycoside hydrolase family 127 protein [Oscillospiraceae bacterium]
MNNINFSNITITGGFWKNRLDINRDVTTVAVKNRFEETGRFKALKCEWKEEMPNRPHFFWDSDVAKWIEGAAYILRQHKDPELETFIESLIDDIEKNQHKSGYFNSFFLTARDEKPFTKRDFHELYCAGHLIEAAVAWYETTGRDRFLKLMKKYSEHIAKIFMDEESADFDTPGHEEIELALFRLYRCTGEERWLNLAEFFLNRRGSSEKDLHCDQPEWMTHSYNQSLYGIRSQDTARGHAVRACYLYCAMADLAAERKHDKALRSACEKLFYDITHRKMYITGGIGSSHAGEAFTRPYDLPNDTAYAETCASIALAMFALRMQQLSCDGVYADTVERTIFNGILSGVSLGGDSFFYCNPLELTPHLKDKDNSVRGNSRNWQPATKRAKVFGCSCCPPNLTRFFASLGNYIYSENDGGLYINQYIPNKLDNGKKAAEISTEYPKNGFVKIKADGYSFIALRIPGWCSSFSINKKYTMKNGYAIIENTAGEITLDMQMRPTLIQASNLVTENCGRAVMQLGPVVYCLEELDNAAPVRALSVNSELSAKIEYDETFSANVIYADGFKLCGDDNKLYSEYTGKKEPVRLKFIPFFAFANRKESSMAVWNRVN